MKMKKIVSMLIVLCFALCGLTAFAATRGDLINDGSETVTDYVKIGDFTGDENTLNGGWFFPSQYTDSIKIGDYIFMTRGSHFRADNDANAAQNGDGYVRAINVNDGSAYNLEQKTVGEYSVDYEGEGLNKAYEVSGKSVSPTKGSLNYYIPSKLLYDEESKILYVGYISIEYNSKYVGSDMSRNDIGGKLGGLRVYNMADSANPVDITGSVEIATMSVQNEKYTMPYKKYIPLQFYTVRSNGDIKSEPSAVYDMILKDNILYCSSMWGIMALDVTNPSALRSLLWWQNINYATVYLSDDGKAAMEANASVTANLPIGMAIDGNKLYVATRYTLLQYDISDMSADLPTGSLRQNYFPCKWGRLVGDNTKGEGIAATRLGTITGTQGILSVDGSTVKIYNSGTNSFYTATFTESGNKLNLTVKNTPKNTTPSNPYAHQINQDDLTAMISGNAKIKSSAYYYDAKQYGDLVYVIGGSKNFLYVYDISADDPHLTDAVSLWGNYANNAGIRSDSHNWGGTADSSSAPTAFAFDDNGDVYIFTEKVGLVKYSFTKQLLANIDYDGKTAIDGDVTANIKAINLMPTKVKDVAAITAKYSVDNGCVTMLGGYEFDRAALEPGKVYTASHTMAYEEAANTIKTFVFDDFETLTPGSLNSVTK